MTQRVDAVSQALAHDIAAPEHRRAMRKLGLVVVAGELAQEYGILPHNLDIRAAVESVRDAWLGDHENRPSSILGARAVKAFILRRRDCFRDRFDADIGPVTSRDICGYYDRQNGLYLFTDEGFAEACGGHNPQIVAAELAARGLLQTDEDHYKVNKPSSKTVSNVVRDSTRSKGTFLMRTLTDRSRLANPSRGTWGRGASPQCANTLAVH